MNARSFEGLEEEFRRYLLTVRANTDRSIAKHITAWRLLARFLRQKRIRSAARLTLALAYEFLEDRSRGRRKKYILTLQGSLRHMFRFLCFTRILRGNLAERLIATRVFALADVPKAFSDDDCMRIREYLRAPTFKDLRARAIMELFLNYGLRLGEVVNLQLDDIDWARKTITARERKNRVPLVLPLLPEVEAALRAYLRYRRPTDAKTSRLFVRTKGRVWQPLSPLGVHEVVKKVLAECGVRGSATTFRHTLATSLINDGVELRAIQALLGHGSSDSTRVYAKVHWKALREVAENHSLLL